MVSASQQQALGALLDGRRVDRRTTGTIKSLTHYTILVVGFTAALQTAGINLTALFAAGAIFAIAVGFAMQSIAQNFVPVSFCWLKGRSSREMCSRLKGGSSAWK